MKPAAVADRTIEPLISKLAATDPEEREAAMARILALGEGAIPALEAAAKTDDAEIRGRAEALVCRLQPRAPSRTIPATSLALLAFLGAGYSHLSRDKHDGVCFGESVKQALKFLLAAQQADGAIGKGTEHILATLALSEAYGLTGSALFKEQSQRAVDVLCASQDRDGGWGAPCDTITTTWAVMALKSAELAGLSFPRSSCDGARRWVESVTDDNGRAGLSTRGDRKSKGHETSTACGTISRIFIDRNKQDPALAKGCALLVDDPPGSRDEDITYRYFSGMALFQFDGPAGERWRTYWRAHRETWVPMQVAGAGCDRGSWSATRDWGIVETTALGALSLEVYWR